MASPNTRSSKRVELHTTRSQAANRQSHHQNNHSPLKHPQELPNTRRKRPRDSHDIDHDALLNKKARLGVEVVSRPKIPLKRRADIVIDAPDKPRTISVDRPQQHKNAATNNINGISHESKNANSIATARAPTKHAEKVVAGIKHELDRLQPVEADTRDEKRKLRSQEGTRFKSELALYFPDYDVVIGNEPEETHLLNIDTPILMTDSKPQPQKAVSPGRIRIPKSPSRLPPKAFPSSLYENLHEAQKVDFSALERELPSNTHQDPLPPSYYDAAHKRAERVERNIRNTEKGRAQHEKDQVIRLLEGLQGHDWLKIMGVSGITESKKKDYTAAREHFIRGCQFIIEKFRLWKEEEKRRKAEKDRLLAEAEEEVEDEEVDAEEENEDGNESDGDPPDYSDVDHAAARQLHEEAMSRINARSASTSSSKRRSNTAPIDFVVETPEKEFKSFFKKPHLREAALGAHRRSGRSASAFGQPIPDLPEQSFDLPDEFIETSILDSNARTRRRERRMSKE